MDSIGDLLKGDKPGLRHVFTTLAPGASITTGPASDPAAGPGGTFTSITASNGVKKTLTYDGQGAVIKVNGKPV